MDIIKYIKELIAFGEDNDIFRIIGLTDAKNIIKLDDTHYAVTDITYIFEKVNVNQDDYEQPLEFIDHYYVYQTSGYCGDDYSGILLVPIDKESYLRVKFEC
ncbi:hypothetical protein [Vallitalea guaymasensis]|uniref:hypothetical protein n=1 Tax=Vallitalea guaymasensis TaxID=1185412 RepID=UPI000DE1B8AE|nr:hypothetical protein [Vallitalea guaymasensis]